MYRPTGISGRFPRTTAQAVPRDQPRVSFCYTKAPSDSHVIVRKFHDETNFGERDGGEDWLAGWEFLLERGDSETGPWTHVADL